MGKLQKAYNALMPISPAKANVGCTREDLFIIEYIQCRFNGAEAVRRVYNIGGKGGSRDRRSSTARTMAAQLLAKPSVKAKLMQRMESAEMGIPFIGIMRAARYVCITSSLSSLPQNLL